MSVCCSVPRCFIIQFNSELSPGSCNTRRRNAPGAGVRCSAAFWRDVVTFCWLDAVRVVQKREGCSSFQSLFSLVGLNSVQITKWRLLWLHIFVIGYKYPLDYLHVSSNCHLKKSRREFHRLCWINAATLSTDSELFSNCHFFMDTYKFVHQWQSLPAHIFHAHKQKIAFTYAAHSNTKPKANISLSRSKPGPLTGPDICQIHLDQSHSFRTKLLHKPSMNEIFKSHFPESYRNDLDETWNAPECLKLRLQRILCVSNKRVFSVTYLDEFFLCSVNTAVKSSRFAPEQKSASWHSE